MVSTCSRVKARFPSTERLSIVHLAGELARDGAAAAEVPAAFFCAGRP
jgi:hypothetical protein